MSNYFNLNIDNNPNGWGPTTLLEKFTGVPYEVHIKHAKLGKIADWNAPVNSDVARGY